jgi:hypothetical protein
VDTKRVSCRHVIEDRDHLFFGYSYSGRIWRSIMSLCNAKKPLFCWDDIIAEELAQ